jgi:hypothetical protein
MARTEFRNGVEGRLAHLDKIDRRCDANSRHCVNKAVVEVDLFALNADGVRIGEQQKKKICAKHLHRYFDSSGWEVIAERDLTGTHDDQGNRTVEGPWERAAKLRSQRPTPSTAPATDMRFSG